MKRLTYAVCVAVFLFVLGVSAQTPAQPMSVEQELIKLENGWNDALIKQDWAFLDKLLADDYISTDSDGVVQTKAQSMAKLKSGEEVFISAVNDDFRVRVYGDAAVVTLR